MGYGRLDIYLGVGIPFFIVIMLWTIVCFYCCIFFNTHQYFPTKIVVNKTWILNFILVTKRVVMCRNFLISFPLHFIYNKYIYVIFFFFFFFSYHMIFELPSRMAFWIRLKRCNNLIENVILLLLFPLPTIKKVSWKIN